jgi:hypothetical protein
LLGLVFIFFFSPVIIKDLFSLGKLLLTLGFFLLKGLLMLLI